MKPSSSRNGSQGARFGGHLVSLAVLLACHPLLRADEGVYAVTQVLARSEPNAIMDAVNGWHGPYGPGKRQYAWSWFEAGVRGENWGIGALLRWDYDLRFNHDAASLYGAVQNKDLLPVGHAYGVEVQAHVVHATGLRLSWRGNPTPELRTEFGFSLLKSNYMIEGSLAGTALVTAPKTYTYIASTDYAYTKDILFDRAVSPQPGYGFALDLAADWRFQPNWRAKVQVRDLPGYVWWKNLPYTQAGATSDRTQTDNQGFTHWAPLVSGQESNYTTFRQNLPTRGELELACDRWPLAPAMGVDYQFGDWLPRLGLARTMGGFQLQGWCWPTTRALGFQVDHGKWMVGLSMDNLQWGLVKMVNLTLGYNR